MQVLAVLTGKLSPTPAKAGMTGYFKTPVAEARVTTLGLAGDQIGDTDNHGGVDQAVYIFTEPDRVWWADFLTRDVGPGYFGENLLVSDLTSADLCIGDRLAIGEVLLEITSPRIPCTTFAAHVGDPQAIKWFYQAQRPGAYARVLAEGVIRPGDPIVFTPYVGDRITMIEDTAAYLSHHKDTADLLRRLDIPAHHKAKALARARLAQG